MPLGVASRGEKANNLAATDEGGRGGGAFGA
jgi:hypothetical protein